MDVTFSKQLGDALTAADVIFIELFLHECCDTYMFTHSCILTYHLQYHHLPGTIDIHFFFFKGVTKGVTTVQLK